tara:strand:+ start:10812 stop:12617 length:1806 start_codon:yes stop_codon:yes gene_type:complete
MARRKPSIEKINYTSRDFDSIKEDLVAHARRYYPETYKDFNKASFGSLMLDTVAYIGDILSFYLDYQANESFLETAIEPKNILSLARAKNYNHDFSQTSFGVLTGYVIVPAQASNNAPDTSYIPILKAGSLVGTRTGVTLSLADDMDFSNSNNEVVVATIDDLTQQPLTYAIKAHAPVVTGLLKVNTFSVGSFKRFLRIDVTDIENPVSEVLSVVDTKGNEYFEVDHLSQDFILKGVRDASNEQKAAVSFLRRVPVPRRFVVERINGRVFLQFGHGSEDDIKSAPIANPSSVVLDMHGKDYVTDSSFDPTNLIGNDKMGVAPSDTILTVTYRASQLSNANIPANSVNRVIDPIMSFKNAGNANIVDIKFVQDSLQVSNDAPIVGSNSTFSSDEVRLRAKETYFSQNRAVTREDYTGIVYRMPKKFGTIALAKAMADPDSVRRNMNMHVLSTGVDGKFTKTPRIVKQNLKSWLLQYKMVNDTIDILDGRVINFAVDYKIIAEFKFNKYEILNACNLELNRLFANYREFGEPLYITDVYKTLNNIKGVIDTTNVKVTQRLGGEYSAGFYNFDTATVDGRYIICPSDAVFELKNPLVDINGSVK